MRSLTSVSVLPASDERSKRRNVVRSGSVSAWSVVAVPPAVELGAALDVVESATATGRVATGVGLGKGGGVGVGVATGVGVGVGVATGVGVGVGVCVGVGVATGGTAGVEVVPGPGILSTS